MKTVCWNAATREWVNAITGEVVHDDTVKAKLNAVRCDTLIGYGIPNPTWPRDRFFALLNMPGAE